MRSALFDFADKATITKMLSHIDAFSVNELVSLAVAGDSQRILHWMNLRYARDGGLAPTIEEWIIPMLRECGLRWERGQFSIADEHVVTHVVTDALAGIRMQFTRIRSCATAAAVTLGGDNHEIGSRLAQACIESQGLRCALLGLALTAADIAEWALENSLDLLCCSIPVTLLPERAEHEIFTLVAQLQPQTRVLLGGAGTHALSRIPSDAEVMHSLRDLESIAASITGKSKWLPPH
jgi:methanogenic corrinoid protein MtbC1